MIDSRDITDSRRQKSEPEVKGKGKLPLLNNSIHEFIQNSNTDDSINMSLNSIPHKVKKPKRKKEQEVSKSVVGSILQKSPYLSESPIHKDPRRVV